MKSSMYRAYLLRLWRDSERQPWRVQLVNPFTGQRRAFVSLEQAYAYLREQLASIDKDSNRGRSKSDET